MILVDTSVWVDHFRRRNPILVALLDQASVATHPFVIGELALGQRRPDDLIALLTDLPAAGVVPHDDVLALVDRQALAGSGIGWVDAHLLASAAVERLPLWTLDRRLAATAGRAGVSFGPRDLRT